MLDAYEIRKNKFEIVDSAFIELRSKKMLYYRLVRFVLILLIILISTFIVLSISTLNLLWLLTTIIPGAFVVYFYRSLQRLKLSLSPQISSIILEFSKEKQIELFRIRRWQQTKMDEYLEEDVRYNQAVGFRVTWFDDGFLELEIIVDENFPGQVIFQTYDFLVIAELYKLFELVTPDLDRWVYQLEDGSVWPEEAKGEIDTEQLTVKIPWILREYFDGL